MNENIRLPKIAVPHRYEINLDINLDEFSYTGKEVVFLEIVDETKELQLHSLGIDIENAFIENDSGEHVLTNEVLQHLIRFYGSGMQTNMAHFLEQSISFFLNQQEAMQDQVRTVMGANSPIGMFQKMTEDNMKLWESMSQTMLGRKPSIKDE